MTTLASNLDSSKSFKDIPAPPAHWLLGNLKEAKQQPLHRYVYSLADQFGSLARFRLLNKSLLVASDPETVRSLLKARPETIRRSRKIENTFKGMRIHGVFSAEGQDWQRQRQRMNPAFKPSQIKAFFPIIQRCTQTLCESLSVHPQKHDIQKTLMSYTVDITSALAFGIDLNTLEQEDKAFQSHLNRIFPMLTHRMHKPFAYWNWIKFKKDRELESSLDYVYDKVAKLIKQAQNNILDKQKINPDYTGDNLLESMILGTSEGGKTFSQKELFANVITLLLAGEDTTANTLAWTMHFLADNPLLQQQVKQEIDEHYPQDHPLTFEDLDHFPLTFACAQEAMRMVPVAPWLLLEPNEDISIEGYHVPQGTTIFALLGNNGFQNACFPKADAYHPERWLNLNANDKKRFANELLHFGFGTRLCPGRQLSFVEMKVALIETLKRFHFSRSPGSQVTEKLAFTVMPENLLLDLKSY